MKIKTITALALIALIILGGLFYVFFVSPGGKKASSDSGPGRAGAARVETVAASLETIEEVLCLTGTVEPYRLARLASPAEGPVLDIRVREGDTVTAGQALLSLGRRKGADALVEALRAEVKKEADNLARTRRLVAEQALPAESLERAVSDHERVLAELARAEESRLDYALKAPFAGVVADVFIREGGFVAPRQALLEMYDPDSLVIRAAAPEKYALRIEPGMPLDIRLDARPGETLPGKISRVYPALDDRLRTRTMEILPQQPLAMLPGMFARLALKLQTVTGAVVVPVEAIQPGAGGKTVFVVKDGKAEARAVTIGIESGGRVEIRQGLVAGDRVIVKGAGGLKEGQAVSPLTRSKSGDITPAGGDDRK